MKTSAIIIYHADCPDGFGAALSAWKHFGDRAQYIPLHHGQHWQPADLADQSIYIFDYAFSPERLAELAGQARSVLQLDHHASARAEWATLLQAGPDGTDSFTHPTLPLRAIFDLDKSGARLAWEHFFPETEIPLLLQHVEDMDLWRFALTDTRAFSRALRLQAMDFTTWDQLLAAMPDSESPRYREMIAEGRAIEKFFEREIERLVHSRLVMPATLAGESVDALQARRHGQALIEEENGWRQAIPGLAVNADALFTSELGHRLAERSGTFGLIWQLAADGEIKISLRAAGQLDVSRIASHYGGGGHRNAAGFRMAPQRFFREILGIAATP